MPRGRRKTMDYPGQIAELESSISALRAELKKEEAALKELREQQEREEMSRLYAAIRARSLNVDEVLSLLDHQKTEEDFSAPVPCQALT